MARGSAAWNRTHEVNLQRDFRRDSPDFLQAPCVEEAKSMPQPADHDSYHGHSSPNGSNIRRLIVAYPGC